MIVVDASVIATGLADDGPDGDRVRARLRGEQLVAPHIIDLEVSSVWRRLIAAGDLDERRAMLAMRDLEALRIERAAHRPLLARCWDLRHDLTVYDASYVALAEVMQVTLLTGDTRLRKAPGIRCDVEVI